MLAKLEQLAARHEEVGALLAEPDIIGDNDRFRALSQEYAQLEPVAQGFRAYRQVLDDLTAAREMASDRDPDLRALAQDELLDAETRRATANAVETLFRSVPYVVDVDTSQGQPRPRLRLVADRDKLDYYGLSERELLDSVAMLMGERTLG